MSSNNWSPIIYASTYIVDFRSIIKPDDFNKLKTDWAIENILITTQLKGKNWAQELRNCPRWSLFKDNNHCIVGVTCMADMLSESMNQDRFGRPLYAFVGCVSQLPSTQLPPLTIEFFKTIYERYIGERWEEKNSQSKKADEKAKSQYSEYPIGYYNFDREQLPKLNTQAGKLRLFPQPQTEEERNKFLMAAFQSQQSTSICLGLPTQQYVSQGVFLNATAIDINEQIDIVIAPKESDSSLKPSDILKEQVKSTNFVDKNQNASQKVQYPVQNQVSHDSNTVNRSETDRDSSFQTRNKHQRPKESKPLEEDLGGKIGNFFYKLGSDLIGNVGDILIPPPPFKKGRPFVEKDKEANEKKTRQEPEIMEEKDPNPDLLTQSFESGYFRPKSIKNDVNQNEQGDNNQPD